MIFIVIHSKVSFMGEQLAYSLLYSYSTVKTTILRDIILIMIISYKVKAKKKAIPSLNTVLGSDTGVSSRQSSECGSSSCTRVLLIFRVKRTV